MYIDFWWDIVGVQYRPNKDMLCCYVCKRAANNYGKIEYNGVYGHDEEVPFLGGPICSDQCLDMVIKDRLCSDIDPVDPILDAMNRLYDEVGVSLKFSDNFNHGDAKGQLFALCRIDVWVGSIATRLAMIEDALDFAKKTLKEEVKS